MTSDLVQQHQYKKGGGVRLVLWNLTSPHSETMQVFSSEVHLSVYYLACLCTYFHIYIKFETRSGQTKDYKICICCFPA